MAARERGPENGGTAAALPPRRRQADCARTGGFWSIADRLSND